MEILFIILIAMLTAWSMATLYYYFTAKKNLKQYNRIQIEVKEQRKLKILKFLEHHVQITNDDTVELLEISDATAFRYLEELQSEGKILQIGERGKNVYYILK